MDGLRALAALAVVVLHAFQINGLGLTALEEVTGQTSSSVFNERGGLGVGPIDQAFVTAYFAGVHWGFLAVQVFIVISGFSLMIQVARSEDTRLRHGIKTFFRRRARRILPPYYAAVGFSLLIIALVPGMNQADNVYWDLALPAFEPLVILSHLLLIHNLTWDWYLKINPPLWSIAVEWQIYFLFPFLVLVWRRAGPYLTTGIALAFGLVPIFVSVPWYPLSNAWFVGLFGLGMLGATLTFSPSPSIARMRSRLPTRVILLASVLLFLALPVGRRLLGLDTTAFWLRDYVLGFMVVALLVHCGKRVMHPGNRRSVVLGLLESRPLVSVGQFSYSVYLIHAPILALVALGCRQLQLPATLLHLVVLGAGIPLILALAYLFFRFFERPFLAEMPREAQVGRGR